MSTFSFLFFSACSGIAWSRRLIVASIFFLSSLAIRYKRQSLVAVNLLQ